MPKYSGVWADQSIENTGLENWTHDYQWCHWFSDGCQICFRNCSFYGWLLAVALLVNTPITSALLLVFCCNLSELHIHRSHYQCNCSVSRLVAAAWQPTSTSPEKSSKRLGGPKRSACLFAKLQFINCHKQSSLLAHKSFFFIFWF